MDISINGEWRFDMIAPDGKRYTNRMQFRRIERPHLIEFDHGADEDDDPGIFRTTITFDEQSDGKTMITLRQLHPTTAQRKRGSDSGQSNSAIRPSRSWRNMSNAVTLLKRILAARPRQNNPTGKSPKICPALLRKNIPIFNVENQSIFPTSHPMRGADRDRHGRAVGCGGTRELRLTSAIERTAKPCGPDTPTLVSSSREAKLLADDGDKQALSPGRSRIIRKPLRKVGCFR